MFNDPTPQLQLSDSKSANEPPVTPADVARERDADAEAIQRLAEREAMRTATAATAAATTAQITSALMASTPFVIRRNSSEVSAR